MTDKVAAIAAVLFFGLLFVGSLMYSINLPEVQTSHSTGECVKVINYVESDEYTCENLPEKYHHVWVK